MADIKPFPFRCAAIFGKALTANAVVRLLRGTCESGLNRFMPCFFGITRNLLTILLPGTTFQQGNYTFSLPAQGKHVFGTTYLSGHYFNYLTIRESSLSFQACTNKDVIPVYLVSVICFHTSWRVMCFFHSLQMNSISKEC